MSSSKHNGGVPMVNIPKLNTGDLQSPAIPGSPMGSMKRINTNSRFKRVTSTKTPRVRGMVGGGGAIALQERLSAAIRQFQPHIAEEADSWGIHSGPLTYREALHRRLMCSPSIRTEDAFIDPSSRASIPHAHRLQLTSRYPPTERNAGILSKLTLWFTRNSQRRVARLGAQAACCDVDQLLAPVRSAYAHSLLLRDQVTYRKRALKKYGRKQLKEEKKRLLHERRQSLHDYDGCSDGSLGSVSDLSDVDEAAPPPPPSDVSSASYHLNSNPTLLRTMIRVMGVPTIIKVIICAFLVSAAPFGLVVMIERLGNFISDSNDPPVNGSAPPAWEGYLYAALVFVLVVIQALATSQAERYSAQMRSLLHGALMVHTMNIATHRLPFVSISGLLSTATIGNNIHSEEEEEMKAGQPARSTKKAEADSQSNTDDESVGADLLQLVTSDIEIIAEMIPFFLVVLFYSAEVVTAFTYLGFLSGWPVVGPIAVFLAFIPFNRFASKCYLVAYEAKSAAGDRRLAAVSELLSSIKAIKIYGWEHTFIGRALALRDLEIHHISSLMGYMALFNGSFALSGPLMQLSLFFLVWVGPADYGTLDSVFVYEAMSLLFIIAWRLNVIPYQLSEVLRVYVSLTRLEMWYSSNSLPPDSLTTSTTTTTTAQSATVAVVGNDGGDEGGAVLRVAIVSEGGYVNVDVDPIINRTALLPPSGILDRQSVLASDRGKVRIYNALFVHPDVDRFRTGKVEVPIGPTATEGAPQLATELTPDPSVFTPHQANLKQVVDCFDEECFVFANNASTNSTCRLGRNRSRSRRRNSAESDLAASDSVAPPHVPPPIELPGFVLRCADFKCDPGELVCVVGRVGSGKSSLVAALMQYMRVFNPIIGEALRRNTHTTPTPLHTTHNEYEALRMLLGEYRGLVGGTVSLVPQTPWILNGTVRNNIVLDLPFDEARYAKVLAASALGVDLSQFSHGDATVVGDKGATLSGGQRQRISIARALYRDADVYIFDDSLSALDATVGHRVFEDAIQGLLMHKARIFVTHNLGFLPVADRIYVVDDGAVVEQKLPKTIPSCPPVGVREAPLVGILRAWKSAMAAITRAVELQHHHHHQQSSFSGSLSSRLHQSPSQQPSTIPLPLALILGAGADSPHTTTQLTLFHPHRGGGLVASEMTPTLSLLSLGSPRNQTRLQSLDIYESSGGGGALLRTQDESVSSPRVQMGPRHYSVLTRSQGKSDKVAVPSTCPPPSVGCLALQSQPSHLPTRRSPNHHEDSTPSSFLTSTRSLVEPDGDQLFGGSSSPRGPWQGGRLHTTFVPRLNPSSSYEVGHRPLLTPRSLTCRSHPIHHMSTSKTTPRTESHHSGRQQFGITPPPGPALTPEHQSVRDSWDDSLTTSPQQPLIPLISSNDQPPTTKTRRPIATTTTSATGSRTLSGLNTVGINFTEPASFLESISSNSLDESMLHVAAKKGGAGLTSFTRVVHQSTLEHGATHQNPLADTDDEEDPGSPLVPGRFSASMQHRVFASTAVADSDAADDLLMMNPNSFDNASRKVSGKVVFAGNVTDGGENFKDNGGLEDNGGVEDVDALMECISAGFDRQNSELATAIFMQRGLVPETAQLGISDHIIDESSPLGDDVEHSSNVSGTDHPNPTNLSLSSVHNTPHTSPSPPPLLMPPPLISAGVLRCRSNKSSFHPMLVDSEAVMHRQMSARFNDTHPLISLHVPETTTSATASANPKGISTAGGLTRVSTVVSPLPQHPPSPPSHRHPSLSSPTNEPITENIHTDAYANDETIDLGATRAVTVLPPPEEGHPRDATLSSQHDQDDADMVSIPSLLVYLGTFGGCLFWTVLGLLHIFAVALVAISQLWIGEWADEQTSVWGIERSSVPSVVFLCIYAGFLILSSIMVLLREFLWREGVIKPPTVLYAAMLNAAAHAPQTFFDNNPLGRILTRFSRDAEQLDFDVPTALNEVAVGAFTQIVTLASVCVVIPYFTPVAVIVIVALAFLGPPPATLRLRKIADDALSPIHALFSEADSGGSAVSALGLSDLFKTRLIRALDNYNGARYMEKISMEFVRLRGSLVMCVATGIVMFVLVYIRDTMTAATSGFIINQALQLCNFVSFMLLQEGTALLSLNSVDRVVKFTEIEQELKTDPPPPTTNINVEGDIDLLSMSTRTYRSPVISSPDTEFQSLEFGVKESIDWEKWPSCGEVRLIRCCAQYQPELPLVLRDVSVVFEGGRKVGVCGRTGSGKSTLLQVLLRMVRFYSSPLPSTTDPATSELDPAAATTSSSAPLSPPTPPPPAVLIDGVDITTVPLNILRQRVTVIPQEPTVFSGSVAYNLSPEFGLWCRNNEDLMMSILSACEITDPLAPLRSEEENDDIVAMSLGTLLAASCVDYTVRSDANNKDTTESADYHKRCVIRLIRLMARSLDQAHLWTFFQRCCGDGPTSSPFSPLFVELGPEGLLSIGQKQLLCLARAALRRAKLLLLDEATSSVDPMTDKLIQEIVKQRFMGCTVVTIAHRVDTILDCDDVLVLDRGSVLEFNTPSILLGPRNISSTPATTTVTTPPSYGAVVDASGRTEAVGAFAALVSRSAPD